MAAASQLLLRNLPGTAPCLCSNRLFLRRTTSTKETPILISPVTQSRPALAFARHRKGSSSSFSSAKAPSSNKKKKLKQSDYEEEDDLDEDAFEALFSQLEEDLKNDDMPDDDDEDDEDDEVSEEDLAMLEKELEDAFGVGSDEDHSEESQSDADGAYDDDDEEEEEEEEELPVKLKTWQLRRLASALKIGRRKTSIKSLAGELGLDRAVVLELLREPPPDLLLMCASLPDKVITTPVEPTCPLVEQPESKPAEYSSIAAAAKEKKPAVKAPVHAMYNKWSSQKRLKKIQLDTLERIYSRTKRPTNAMISSIVHVTNLPWKRVVKWFEEKRIEDGVPDRRVPYRRFVHEDVPRT